MTHLYEQRDTTSNNQRIIKTSNAAILDRNLAVDSIGKQGVESNTDATRTE